MSRNLLRTDCYFCHGPVKLCEEPRPITPGEAGPYFKEYETMQVAHAICLVCGAKYLAWCKPPNQGVHMKDWTTRYDGEEGFFDLSFRSTFNDEPGEADMPTHGAPQKTTIAPVTASIQQQERGEMSEPTVKDVRAKAHEMQDAITEVLQAFEEETGCTVRSIDVERIHGKLGSRGVPMVANIDVQVYGL